MSESVNVVVATGPEIDLERLRLLACPPSCRLEGDEREAVFGVPPRHWAEFCVMARQLGLRLNRVYRNEDPAPRGYYTSSRPNWNGARA